MENGKSRLQRAQDDVEEVKVIMLDNLNKADERAGKLEDLEERAEELQQKGKAFEKRTKTIKQKKRWEHNKMKVVLAVIGGVVAVVIIGVIIFFSVGQ
ncbi:uncharacterized protein V6R79_024950 [Siganus canaliculatus]